MKQTLQGLRVIEVGHFVAAPFCTRLLADLGADVIKIEPLCGDPVRRWGESANGRSLWWSVHARNKKSVSLDLKSEVGREVVLKLAKDADVLVENFRPGQLTRMGLGPNVLRSVNPSLIMAHVSGYGQSGPGCNRAAFGAIGEAVGGLRYLTNHTTATSSLPPVRVGVSIGDSIAGLYSAFGVMAALWQRDATRGDGEARTIDVALTESILSMMEGMLPEYGALGKVKQPTGGGIATAAPTNAYPTADGVWILIAANSEPLFAKLAGLAKRPDWLDNPDYADNRLRVQHSERLDEEIAAWTRNLQSGELLAQLARDDIPSCKVYTSADCASDEQYLARGMVRNVQDPLLGKVLHPGVVPHIPECPGEIRWTGRDIGADTEEVLSSLEGFTAERIAALREAGTIA